MSVKSRKRELALPVLLAACLLACLLIGGSFFTKYLQVKIYEERTTQLTEITSQVRVNLSNALDAHWSYLNTAVNALRHQRFASGEEMTAYIGTLERLLEGNCIPTPSVVIRRDLLERSIEEVRPQERNWMMGDYPMWLYAAAHAEIRFINEPLAVYRILDESASHFRSFEKADRFCRSTLDIRRYFAGRYAPHLLPRLEENSLWERFGFAVHYRNAQAAFSLCDAVRRAGGRFDTQERRALRRRTRRMIWRHPILWLTRK